VSVQWSTPGQDHKSLWQGNVIVITLHSITFAVVTAIVVISLQQSDHLINSIVVSRGTACRCNNVGCIDAACSCV
jgi:hypothetical protein